MPVLVSVRVTTPAVRSAAARFGFRHRVDEPVELRGAAPCHQRIDRCVGGRGHLSHRLEADGDGGAEPAARQAGVKYEGYNSSAGSRIGPWTYTVVMAPVPALVAAAVRDSAPGAIINIFAGIPVDKSGPVDLDAYCRGGMYFIGTSGSRMDDMRAVLRKVEDGRLNTNVSVAAVAGLDGAMDGMRAVQNQEVPGKILIYPACRGMPLTRLEHLSRIAPDVAARLADGVWTLEAEDALRARYGAG